MRPCTFNMFLSWTFYQVMKYVKSSSISSFLVIWYCLPFAWMLSEVCCMLCNSCLTKNSASLIGAQLCSKGKWPSNYSEHVILYFFLIERVFKSEVYMLCKKKRIVGIVVVNSSMWWFLIDELRKMPIEQIKFTCTNKVFFL